MIDINENQQILDLPGQPSRIWLIRPSPEGFDSRMRLPRLSQHLLEVVLPEILQHKVRLVRVLDLAKLKRIADVYELPPHRLVVTKNRGDGHVSSLLGGRLDTSPRGDDRL